MQSIKKISEEHFWDALGALPPAFRNGNGFLLGEPHDHRICEISKKHQPSFAAFFEVRGVFYQAESAMTVSEYRAFDIHSAITALNSNSLNVAVKRATPKMTP